MEDITRKNFLKTAGMAFAGLAATSTPAKSNDNDVDVNTYKNDPIGFIEKYFVLENGKNIKLRDYQKDYIRRLNINEFFVCNKCRQAGLTTINIAFAYWKAVCFDNTNIIIIEPNFLTATTVKQLFLLNMLKMKPFAKSNSLAVVPAESFNMKLLDESKHNIVILDEMVFYNDKFVKHIKDLELTADQLIFVSTPRHSDDIFGIACKYTRYISTIDCHKSNCYMKISGDMVFSKIRPLSIKRTSSEDNFDFGYINKFKISSLS